MSFLGDLINKYRELIIKVLRLSVNCCGDDCIMRVLDVTRLRDINCGVYGLMIDRAQVGELLRRPSIIKLLLDRGINRLITYPCIDQGLIRFLERLGFTVINYITGDECVVTREVVTHLNAYKVIDLARRGVVVYVHLYRPYIRRGQYDAVSLFDTAFEYLARGNVKIHLILDST
ncbi:MAG: hypothetical protein L7H10_01740 [Vulcanisaeta sp.]|jgi:hypothetical protein|nr:hypothetical protein [Vulcanisaeta sp.]MCG2869452.1 hypothetical protein [Vulcanisaeta sp.]